MPSDARVSVENHNEEGSQYTLGLWLITGPFHPVWNQWIVSLIHLRDGENEQLPAQRKNPNLTHQLIIASINPDTPATADSPIEEIGLLTPHDLAHQFQAENDAAALERVEQCLELVKQEKLSPDSDYRKTWQRHLAEKSASTI